MTLGITATLETAPTLKDSPDAGDADASTTMQYERDAYNPQKTESFLPKYLNKDLLG